MDVDIFRNFHLTTTLSIPHRFLIWRIHSFSSVFIILQYVSRFVHTFITHSTIMWTFSQLMLAKNKKTAISSVCTYTMHGPERKSGRNRPWHVQSRGHDIIHVTPPSHHIPHVVATTWPVWLHTWPVWCPRLHTALRVSAKCRKSHNGAKIA